VEAVETAIWLTEVAPKVWNVGKAFLEAFAKRHYDANYGLTCLALKLATGAGKTTALGMSLRGGPFTSGVSAT